MKKYILTIALLILIAGFASGTKICMAETGNDSINLSYRLSRDDVSSFYDYGNQFAIEYEYLLKRSIISLFGRLSTVDYKIEETTAMIGEDGTIRGCDLGMRLYPKGGKRMEKFFVGWSFGFLKKDWNEINLGFEQGSYSEYIKKIDTEIGYRFYFGSKRISVTPSAYLGYHWGITHDDIYYGASMSFGYVF
jgi:hypothetical protein